MLFLSAAVHNYNKTKTQKLLPLMQCFTSVLPAQNPPFFPSLYPDIAHSPFYCFIIEKAQIPKY